MVKPIEDISATEVNVISKSSNNNCSVEPSSLEYIEDPYFNIPEGEVTPSLDRFEDQFDDEEITVHCWKDTDGLELETELYLQSLRLDQILIDNSGGTDLEEDSKLCVETEFIARKVNVMPLRLFMRKIADVRVTFQDLSKPYFFKMSTNNSYRQFLDLSGNEAEAASPSSEMPHAGGDPGTPVASPVGGAMMAGELAGLSPEEAELKRAEWSQELARVEEEIGTLRTVLASKVRRSGELKAKLGITVWKELTGDVNQGLRTVKESQVYGNIENCVGQISKAVTSAPIYQKTESVLKTTAEKTTSLFGGITGGLTSKIGQMRNSESFKSLEEKMGSAYENVKTKVSSSRSNSIQSFDEALREANKTPATTPTIPENSIIKQ